LLESLEILLYFNYFLLFIQKNPATNPIENKIPPTKFEVESAKPPIEFPVILKERKKIPIKIEKIMKINVISFIHSGFDLSLNLLISDEISLTLLLVGLSKYGQ